MFIKLEDIADSDLSWVTTQGEDTCLVYENPEVLKKLLKWQFLELPTIVKIATYDKKVDLGKKTTGVVFRQITNYIPSSLVKSIKPVDKSALECVKDG